MARKQSTPPAEATFQCHLRQQSESTEETPFDDGESERPSSEYWLLDIQRQLWMRLSLVPKGRARLRESQPYDISLKHPTTLSFAHLLARQHSPPAAVRLCCYQLRRGRHPSRSYLRRSPPEPAPAALHATDVGPREPGHDWDPSNYLSRSTRTPASRAHAN